MSRNFSNASASSTIKARASVGLGGVRGSYEGTVSSFWKIGGPVVGITVAVGLIVLPKIKKKLVKVKIGNEILKSVIRKDEACENSRIKKDEAEQQCDLDIRKAKGLSQVKTDEIRTLFEIRREFGPMGKSTGQEQNPHEESSLGKWLQWFNREFPMPCYSAIPHISTILDGCPEGFRPAMLFHLIGGYGALAFSNVRARYLDGRYHSPSLQVIIEGGQGSGKSVFKDVYEQDLFQRVVMDNRLKSRTGRTDRIVQTVGTDISKARLMEVIANSRGLSLYAMETEIDTIRKSASKGGGFSSDLLRKAFSGEAVSLDNKHTRDDCHGDFSVRLNYTFTGTPGAVGRFFTDEDYENGTASRICFCAIPEQDRSVPEFDLPEGEELERMRDQLGEWREKYCFRTGEDGTDIPADEYLTDLSYVHGPLGNWIGEQKKADDRMRRMVSPRMATIAFHAAIVLHMLAGEPGEDNPKMRKAVCKLTVYIANHCMERFLHKYYKGAYPVMEKMAGSPLRRKLTDEEIECWYPLWHTPGEDGQPLGYGRIAKMIGVDRDSVKNAFKRYERRNGLR